MTALLSQLFGTVIPNALFWSKNPGTAPVRKTEAQIEHILGQYGLTPTSSDLPAVRQLYAEQGVRVRFALFMEEPGVYAVLRAVEYDGSGSWLIDAVSLRSFIAESIFPPLDPFVLYMGLGWRLVATEPQKAKQLIAELNELVPFPSSYYRSVTATLLALSDPGISK